MKILIDTNILISSALNRSGTPYKAFMKAVSYPNQGIVCEQNLDELLRIFNRKFSHRMADYNSFLSLALTTLDIVPTPTIEQETETKIRDVKDRPILRAAIHANADILLTGDKDFLESGIDHPKAVTAAEFMEL